MLKQLQVTGSKIQGKNPLQVSAFKIQGKNPFTGFRIIKKHLVRYGGYHHLLKINIISIAMDEEEINLDDCFIFVRQSTRHKHMHDKINKIKNFRLFLLKQIESLSMDQLNHIPSGFSNNIIWNIGHMTSAQQTMCYIRAGVPVIVEDRFFQPFVSGTKPGKKFDETEIITIKELFITTVDRLQTDLDANVFQNYSPSVMIPKVYGFEVTNIESALEYLLHHEGFHAGYIHALKHVL